MKEYLATVLLTAASAAILSLLSPAGKTRRYVSFALSVAVMLALLAPLASSRDLSALIPELGDIEMPPLDTAEDLVLHEAERALTEEIARTLSIPEEAISIELSGQGQGEAFRIASVTARLSREYASYLAAVSQYLRREVNSKCEVSVYEG